MVNRPKQQEKKLHEGSGKAALGLSSIAFLAWPDAQFMLSWFNRRPIMKNEFYSFLKHPLTSLGPDSHKKYCIENCIEMLF